MCTWLVRKLANVFPVNKKRLKFFKPASLLLVVSNIRTVKTPWTLTMASVGRWQQRMNSLIKDINVQTSKSR